MKLAFKVEKLDEEQRLAFGWAMISKATDGRTITDLQGDIIEPEELEKAAYEFVLESRAGGEMHQGPARAELVESFVSTPEKLAKMGIPQGALPVGLWVGFKLPAETFEKVKKGELPMFSIEGTCEREPIAEAA